MKRRADRRTRLRCAAALAVLILGLGGQVASATEGGNGGNGSSGQEGGKSGQTRDQGTYYESGEADRPPAGFANLARALSAFQGYSLFLSPEEATARFLMDLTYGPLIELFTALSFQQHFDPPQEAPSTGLAASQETETPASGTSGFVQVGKGLSIVERIQISEKLAGVLGRKDALITEEEGGLPYWIFEEDCGGRAQAADASEPEPPRIIWESETPAADSDQDAAQDAAKGETAADDCEDQSVRDMERRALDFLDDNYFWLQEKFGAKDRKSRERKAKVVQDKLFDELKKAWRRSQ